MNDSFDLLGKKLWTNTGETSLLYQRVADDANDHPLKIMTVGNHEDFKLGKETIT